MHINSNDFISFLSLLRGKKKGGMSKVVILITPNPKKIGNLRSCRFKLSQSFLIFLMSILMIEL